MFFSCVFDEATSALDEKTERGIFEHLISNVDKTCVMITHRSSMLRYCDTILEIYEDGSVSFREKEAEL